MGTRTLTLPLAPKPPRRPIRLAAGMPGRAPMARPEAPPRRLGPVLLISLTLHLSALILLLVSFAHRHAAPEQVPPANYAVVFEGKSPERNSGPNPLQPDAQRPGSPAPTPATPAVPPSPPSPRAQAMVVPQAPPAIALPPPPPPPPPAPLEAKPTPAAPTPPAPREAQVRPATPVPPEPLPPLALAIPRPPPLPSTPAPRRPPETAHASRPPPREAPSAFPRPLAFSLGTPGTALASAAPPRPALAPRSSRLNTIDLSFGPIAGGSLSPSASVQMEGVQVSTDWLNLVSAWWRRHGYYPPQAGMAGEHGDVTLHMRVDRDGRVERLQLIGRSGSQWLDMAALSVFRDAYLPPLPQDMKENQIPFHLTIHYVIIH